MKIISIIIISLMFISHLPAQVKTEWENNEKCSAPESAYYHKDSNAIFVANIVGDGTAEDGNGHIAKISIDGKTINAKWVKGLDAPKGMRSHNGILWVADINKVVKIDISKGKILKKIKIKGANFLNDVAISSKGVVYVSDTLKSTIYRVMITELQASIKFIKI